MAKKIKPRVQDGDGIRIEWAAPGERARRVVSRSNSRITGKYPSWKVGRMVHWESPLELDAFLLHDAAPKVTRFREQPARLVFWLNGVEQKHYPDMDVEADGMRILREIKTERDANRPEIKERTACLAELLPQLGIAYDVMTDKQIRREPQLKNTKLILRYGRTPVELIEREFIRRQINATGFVVWHDVLSDCFGPGSLMKVCRLLLEGMLSMELDEEIKVETQVFCVN